MAWVRLDDQLHNNAKITAVVADDVGALGLWTLCRSWTASQPVQGYIPPRQPGALVQDKRKGPRLAAILVEHRSFHVRGDECDDCREQIKLRHWPDHDDGYVFHDWWKYIPPERDRVTPGTPAEISEKRREAGRTGGLRSGQARKQARQTGQANEANGVSKTTGLLPGAATNGSKPPSNGVTPVPVVPSYEATTGPVPVPPAAAFASTDEANARPVTSGPVTAQTILGEYIDRCRVRPPAQVLGQLGKLLGHLLDEGYAPDDVRRGMAHWATRSLHPATLPSVVNEVLNGGTASGGTNGHPLGRKQAETDTLFEQAYARAQALDAAEEGAT
jgi:hypothetical protein